MAPSETCGADAAEATPEASELELEPEIYGAEAAEAASELEPKRRHRVSRRLIVRARNARLAERRTLRDGGAAPAPVKGAGGGAARARVEDAGSAARARVEDAGGVAGWAPVEGPGGFDTAFATTAAGISRPPPTRSLSAGMSNTVSVSDTSGQRHAAMQTAQDLSQFGEIARIDFSLAGTAGTILVTYFDVRCAQIVLLNMGSRAAPFPQASHDHRVVLVDVPAFCAETGHIGGFQDFGEVANVDIVAGQSAVVEFFDLRSAQALLAAAGDTATAVPAGSAFVPPAIQTRDMLEGVLAKLPAPPGLGRPVAAPAKAVPKGNGRIPDSASEQATDVTKDYMPQTKITKKDFKKFVINPYAILRGEDKRTTVMFRHLHQKGLCSSKDVLLFLERCGLGNRYSFFYMPCKEHCNIPAGFAFVNFVSPHDVGTIYGAVVSGRWREACGRSLAKPPAVSYARFQGHEDLVLHFSVSAVLQEQDPERRPIFRPEMLDWSSVDHPMKVKKVLRIPGPPGLADDAEVLDWSTIGVDAETPHHADLAMQKGASAVLSSKQLELLEALLREKEEHTPKDSFMAGGSTSLKKVKNIASYLGDTEFEAISSRMIGA